MPPAVQPSKFPIPAPQPQSPSRSAETASSSSFASLVGGAAAGEEAQVAAGSGKGAEAAPAGGQGGKLSSEGLPSDVDKDDEADAAPVEVTVGPAGLLSLLAPTAELPACGAGAAGTAAQAPSAPGTQAGAPALPAETLDAMPQAGTAPAGQAAKGEDAAAKGAAPAAATADPAKPVVPVMPEGAKSLAQLSEKAGDTPVSIRVIQGTPAQPAPDAVTTAQVQAQVQAVSVPGLTPQAQRAGDKTGAIAAAAAFGHTGSAAARPSAEAAANGEKAEAETAEAKPGERTVPRPVAELATKPLATGAGGALPEQTAQGTTGTATAAAASPADLGAKPPVPTQFAQHLAATARPDTGAFAAAVSREAATGKKTFEIQLDPPELGRVEVRLEFHRDGRVATHLVVDRPDTLDVLSRDARALERSLAQQGFDLEGGGLSFELRNGNGFAGSFGQRSGSGNGGRGGSQAGDTVPDAAAAQTRPNGRTMASSGLDIRI